MNKKFLIGAALVLAAAIPSAYAFAQTAWPVIIAPAPTVSCPGLSYNLYMGVRDYYTGGQVSALQQFLNARYGNQLVSGYFGVMTYANVARFQREQSVYPITGGVGPLTRAAIARVCGGTTTPPPTTTGFSANPTHGTAPLSVSFAGTVNDASQYVVDFGDGTNSGPLPSICTSTNLCTVSTSHTYGSAGTYNASLSRYISCMYSNPRCMIAVMPVGTVTIQVNSQVQTNTLTVTSPAAGQVYARGSQMNISWGGLIRETFAYEPHASIVDLYTAAGVKVGTIAITNDLKGSYDWRIPGFPQTMMCTMQYPNGLCGTNVQGQYYIQVTAVVGNGFDSNSQVLGTAQSGAFTIQ
ncbi:MAG TPA: peptidoglycan-binding protein [Candidatus Paceibacterota bacterium]|nr:peptidoglycan-binding protein [Candidatus Paceibacterota bacterium]